jgi:hypothetical protein
MPLSWQHISASEGNLQASSIKYVKGILYNCKSKLNIIVHNSFYEFYTTCLNMTL